MRAKTRIPLPLNWVLVLALGFYLTAPGQSAPVESGFLVVKYGDESASPELAAEFLEKLATFLGASIDRGPLKGWIANTPAEAARILRDAHPILLLGPPGLYLELELQQQLPMEVLVQVPRMGATSERYVLVAPKKSELSVENLRGELVRTVFAFDRTYLERVVFPASFQPGVDFQLEPSTNMADEIFLLLEVPEESAASALLLDTELALFFQQDDMVWPELKVVWQSEELPRDLVVAVGSEWTSTEIQRLKRHLLGMKDDPGGAEILELMSSDGLVPCNFELLERARAKYRRSP